MEIDEVECIQLLLKNHQQQNSDIQQTTVKTNLYKFIVVYHRYDQR